ncbi:hypothetical protein Trydic_g984 [Trypoxylus dichotomus]
MSATAQRSSEDDRRETNSEINNKRRDEQPKRYEHAVPRGKRRTRCDHTTLSRDKSPNSNRANEKMKNTQKMFNIDATVAG